MTNEIVEKYFDNLAGEWDSYQECPANVKRALLEKVGIGEGAHVLDVACGTGAITEELHSLTGREVLGIDISGEMINVAKRKFEGKEWAKFEKADFLQFEPSPIVQFEQPRQQNKKGEAFDDIVIYNAYPHFLDPRALAKKAHVLLKDGGRLAIVHSLGRNILNSHHKQHAMHVSRMIGSPLDEAQSFAPLFTVDIAEESDAHYLLVLTRK